MRFIAVIPARYSSTRYPGKALAILAGKPIIQHVYEASVNSGQFDTVIIATDDERIAQAAHSFGGQVCMTSPTHKSGSDRIAEVVRDLECDIVFNVQGDEPFITKEPLAALKEVFHDPKVEVASLMHSMADREDIENPNNVKVVFDSIRNALYFSRSVIPYDRDKVESVTYWKHVGIYAYRKETLLQFVTLPQGRLEKSESLEQLRLLENGITIRMVKTNYKGIGIDTPEDLEQAIKFIG